MRQAIAILLLLASAVPGHSDEHQKYLLIYSINVVPPGQSYAVLCSDNRPDCGTVYHPEERHQWFESVKDALEEMNKITDPPEFSITSGTTSGFIFTTERYSKPTSIIGLYEVHQLPATLEKVGTKHHQVQKYVDEEVPQLEWRVKP